MVRRLNVWDTTVLRIYTEFDVVFDPLQLLQHSTGMTQKNVNEIHAERTGEWCSA